MKYGVIVCPRCKNVKGVDISHKTTRCFRCGKTITLEQVKILFETNSEVELRNYIGLVNAELEGKKEDFENLFKKK